mmetsp:Transcript_28485/g.90781  ORF Transcript_28485/g.90781 Transcript_28485/m.90781 type:complete len:128 (-) Transcript_28485:281-664(-)
MAATSARQARELPSNTGASQDARKDALLNSEQKLRGARAQLQEATRSALETEETGFAVLSDLARQREVIARTSGHVHQIDDNITGARRVLVQMSQRAMLKKVALWFMVLLLLVTLAVVVYFLFIKNK